MSGIGRHRWNDGREYNGEWNNGDREGLGTMIYKNGNKYEGEFKKASRMDMEYYMKKEARILKEIGKMESF